MGILDQAKQWMTPERALAFQGIGMGLSQLGAGQPVDLSPAYAALQQRQQQTQLRKVMEQPGLMDGFTPQQRAILATMPESMAVELIMQRAFAPPPDPTRGVEINDQLVDPLTGRVIGDYRSPEAAPDRKTAQDVNGVLRYVDTGEPVFPNVAEAPDASSLQHFRGADGMDYSFDPGTGAVTPLGTGTEQKDPLTRQIVLPDGSEAMVQWNGETEEWEPAKIPKGGTTAQPAKKLTESQAKTALFARMQSETAPVLDEIEKQWDPANMPDAAARALPIAGNYFQSPEGQMYTTAAMAWAEGALRISTGAAATQPEIERIMQMYFAVPGDTPETVRFKSNMRAMYSRAIEAAQGRDAEGTLMLPDEFVNIVSPPANEMSRDEALKLLEGQ
jgi:hypothetical protein